MMMNSLKILGLIPARGGSQRIKNKNILPVCGAPLIGWTIKAALGSRYLDDIIVSTDCDQIASIAKSLGATIPFMRGAELSSNEASGMDVAIDAIEQMASRHKEYDLICFLQPTSPLRTTKDIDSALEFFVAKKASSVFSVCQASHSPLWMNTLPLDRSANNFANSSIERSQDLPIYYQPNGCIFISNCGALVKELTFYQNSGTFAFVMETENSVDIDEPLDMKFAEFLLKKRKQEKGIF